MAFSKKGSVPKPELNKDGTARKHGGTTVTPVRYHDDFLEDIKLLSDAVKIPRSTLLRDLTYAGYRNLKKDGSFNQMIYQKLNSVSVADSISDENLISFSDELTQMRNGLSRLGNLLNQDIRIKNAYINHLDSPDGGMAALENAYLDERNKINKKYVELFNNQKKLQDATKDPEERDKIAKVMQAIHGNREKELAQLDARYKNDDLAKEKNVISASIEYDRSLKEIIEGLLRKISETMEVVSDGLH